MRGASAGSLEALTDSLRSLVDGGGKTAIAPESEGVNGVFFTGSTASMEVPGDAARTAEDLFAVADILRREPSLRRMTTDASLAAEAKAGFVRQLFGSQLSSGSVDLLAQAVSRRWAATRDLADALELLGVIAVVKGAEKDGEADLLEDELFGLGRLLTDNPELRDALSDPARSAADKRALLHGLLQGRATAATMRLAEQAVTSSHRTVSLAIEDYQRVAADHRNRLVATVRVARDLPEADADRLGRALSEQYGKPVHLNVLVDPHVLGGIKVEIGDDVIDGTVANRLDEARRAMAS